MRTFVRIVLTMYLVAVGVPLTGLATENAASLSGTVLRSNLQPLSQARVQLRDLRTGEALHVVMSDTTGSFSFQFVQPGSYVIEALDAQGRIIGMSAPFDVAAGASLSRSVVAVGAGAAVASGGRAGFSLFGLGPATSLAVLGAAGAAGVTAVVATRGDASPSR